MNDDEAQVEEQLERRGGAVLLTCVTRGCPATEPGHVEERRGALSLRRPSV